MSKHLKVVPIIKMVDLLKIKGSLIMIAESSKGLELFLWGAIGAAYVSYLSYRIDELVRKRKKYTQDKQLSLSLFDGLNIDKQHKQE